MYGFDLWLNERIPSRMDNDISETGGSRISGEEPGGTLFGVRCSRVVLALLALILIASLGIRLYRIDSPSDFHVIRQYHSDILARAYYFELADDIPEWRRNVAGMNRDNEPLLEPPITEYLAAGAYYLAGEEHRWIPRVFSSLFWLAGGAFLFFIGRRFGPSWAAAIAVSYYLFLPFAVLASRSFQPDPLMIMLMLASLLLILRYSERPTLARLLLGAAVAGMALLIKPVALFPIMAVFAALSIQQRGLRATLLSRPTAIFLAVALLPAAFYYGLDPLLGSAVQVQTGGRFVPSLWFDLRYWHQWLVLALYVLGTAPLIAALLGAIVAGPGWARQLLLSLWVSYLLLGLVFSYHIYTHDYYQLQLIPIVALSLIPLISLLGKRVRAVVNRQGLMMTLGGLIGLALVLAAVNARLAIEASEPEYRIASLEQIGEQMHHSQRVFFLGPSNELLAYHGEVSGWIWNPPRPIKRVKVGVEAFFRQGFLSEKEAPSADQEQRALEEFKALIDARSPEFLVETRDLLTIYPALGNYVRSNFPLVANADGYAVYDLAGAGTEGGVQ